MPPSQKTINGTTSLIFSTITITLTASTTYSILQHPNSDFALPQDTQESTIDSFITTWLDTLILTIFTLVFLILTISFLAKYIYQKKRLKWIQTNGTILMTTFDKVTKIPLLKKNGQPAYQITTHWEDPETEDLLDFTSPPIYEDPRPHLTPNQKIPVRIDPNDSSLYIMDTTQFPSIH